MKKIWRVGLWVAGAGLWGGVVLVWGAGWPGAGSVSEPPPQENRLPATDFRRDDLNGQPVELGKLRGKVVLLDFWATWCGPCRAEIPHFNALYAQYRDQGFEIIGVSLDEGGAEGVRAFAREYEMRYPVVMGDSSLTRAFGGIRGIPTTFLIDKQGRIAYTYAGYRDKAVFEQAIEELLSEQRTANSEQ